MGLFCFFSSFFSFLPPPSDLMSDIMYGSTCLGWLDARGSLQNPVTRQQCMSASVAVDSRAPRWAEPREKSHSSDLRGDECQVRRRAPPPTSNLLSPHRAPHHIRPGPIIRCSHCLKLERQDSFLLFTALFFSFLIWDFFFMDRDTL